MPGTVKSCGISFPDGWIWWPIHRGPVKVDELVEEAADGPDAQAVVRRALDVLDALCRDDGFFYCAALWVPDRTTGDVVATARVSLATGPLERDASRDELLEIARGVRSQRGVKLFDRAVVSLEMPAGPAYGCVTVLAETSRGVFGIGRRPSPVQTRAEITVVPPGSSDVLCLSLLTFDSNLIDALGVQAGLIAESIVVGIGPAEDA